MTLRATWSWGSRVKVLFDWGDGNRDENIHTNNPRLSEYLHVYQSIGKFYPSVRIWNYLIDCSNQTRELQSENSSTPVRILIPITGFTISPIRKAWQRTIPLDLLVSLGNGTWINLTIDWNDTTSEFVYIEAVHPAFTVFSQINNYIFQRNRFLIYYLYTGICLEGNECQKERRCNE